MEIPASAQSASVDILQTSSAPQHDSDASLPTEATSSSAAPDPALTFTEPPALRPTQDSHSTQIPTGTPNKQHSPSPPTTSRRYRAPHTQEDNLLIECLLQSGTPPKEIRQQVPHISKTNIYLKYQKYKQTGTSLVDPSTHLPTGRPSRITPAVEQFIRGILAIKPGIELSELERLLREQQGVSVSTTSVSRAIAKILGGPRARGLKSRRLGEAKRERLQADGVLDSTGGVWKGRTGVEYRAGESQEGRVDVEAARVAAAVSASESPAATLVGSAGLPAERAERKTPAAGSGIRKRKNAPVVATATTDTILAHENRVLDPQLAGVDIPSAEQSAVGESTSSGPAPYPKPTEYSHGTTSRPTDLDRDMVNAIYASPYVPMRAPP